MPQKSRALQIQGVKVKAVVIYREPLTTQIEDPVPTGRCGAIPPKAGREAYYIQHPLFSVDLELKAVLTIRSSFGTQISIAQNHLGFVAVSVAAKYVATHP